MATRIEKTLDGTPRFYSDPQWTTVDGCDIFEDRILDKSSVLFDLLLADYTTSPDPDNGMYSNRVWAVDDYSQRGSG